MQKRIKTMMMQNKEQYEHYASSLVPKGAVEKVENGVRRLLVNCEQCYIEAIYPAYYPN